MADKIKKISVNAFEKAVKEIYSPVTNVEWNALSLAIKKHLSLAEVANFVDVCVKACFDKDDATYTPEAKDPAIRSCIITFYTNITLPESVEKQYELIYHSDILDTITPYIDKKQLNAIVSAVDDKIEHHASANIEAINRQMNSLYDVLDRAQNQMAEIFKDADINEIKNIMSTLLTDGFDEEKLVKAYMKNKS